MYIKNKIEKLFEKDLYIYDSNGNKIPSDRIEREYRIIKNFLSLKYRDSKIAIMLSKDYRYLLVILACLELGIVYIPMDKKFPDFRIKQIEEDIEIAYIFKDKTLEHLLKKHTIVKNEYSEKPFSDIAYIIFTSGTTGKPKGVAIKRESLENFIKALSLEVRLDSDDRILQIANFSFDQSLSDIALFVEYGCRLYFSSFEQDIFKLAYEIESYKITFISTVPNNISMLLNEIVLKRSDFSTLRVLLIGGQKFPWSLYLKLKRLFYVNKKEIYNIYGPTECTVYTHIKRVSFSQEDDSLRHNISIGYPLKGVKSIIVDKNFNILGESEDGELLIGGIQVMAGYINNPIKNRESILNLGGERWCRSGDSAFRNNKGEYFIIDRLDETVKIRGFRVNLSDIDAYLQTLNYIEESATITLDEKNEEKSLLSFVVTNNRDITEKIIKRDLSSILLPYQIPRKIILIDKLPVNSNGKVCKKTLKKSIQKEQ